MLGCFQLQGNKADAVELSTNVELIGHVLSGASGPRDAWPWFSPGSEMVALPGGLELLIY